MSHILIIQCSANTITEIHVSKVANNVRHLMTRTQNSELRILFNIIPEDCNKLVIVTIIKITVIKGKKI